jgi:hypothetical protein
LQIAERNLKKAQKALEINYDRKGITDEERNNLSDNVKYAQVVHDLIAYHAQ